MSERPKKVYLAGPIHQQPDSVCKAWRHTATTFLRLAGCDVLDPMAHDYRGREEQHAEEIVSRDKESIELSDVLLVNANAASWGTAMEIAYAFALGKKVIAFATHTSAPSISPWLRFYCTAIFDSLEHAVDAIESESRQGTR